jgi:hypothetical protein
MRSTINRRPLLPLLPQLLRFQQCLRQRFQSPMHDVFLCSKFLGEFQLVVVQQSGVWDDNYGEASAQGV